MTRWVRGPGECDGVIDFYALLSDPAQRDRLRDIYDSGDHLHPSIAAYRAMGDAVDLNLFTDTGTKLTPSARHPGRGQARGR